MRKIYLLLFTVISVFVTLNSNAQNVTVNPGAGSYADLTSAFIAINAGTHTGAITIDIVGNTTEPAAGAILNASGTGSASYASILIRPSGGAARTISGAATAGLPLIDLNGADNVTVDGLNSGGNSLTIENTTVSATSGTSTVRFIGGATGNTITRCSLKGAGTMSVATNGAIVFFSTDAVTANGNDNNTISNCDIGPSGANLPTKGILGNGSTSTTAIGNSGIVINNNNIFDYFGPAVTSAGVAVNGGCNTWSITNNRFYQTGTRTWTTGALHSGINMNSSTSTSGVQGMTITGNLIGYASNTQTGTYTLTGATTGTFRGISFTGISGAIVSNINNNTVAAVSLTGVTSSGTSSSAPFMGIYISNGVAITNSNTIGSQSATGSLVFSTNSASTADIIGMMNFSLDAWTANNNNIGGLTSSNAGAGAANAYGLSLNTSSTVITTMNGNTIGGSVANSIQSTSTAAATQVAGIRFSTSIAAVSGNTIRNLTAAGGTGTTTGASVIGINLISSTPIGNNIAQNTIFNLTNTNTTAATIVTGIQFTGGTGNVVERNLIYGLTSATNSTSAEINGIRVAGGTTTYRNNMIALGAGVTNALGAAASNSGTTGINGINGFLGTDNFFHNSVYIGGSPTAGIGASYAFNGTQTVNTRSFRDNIFFNARSNSGATGTNYAVKINGTTPNPTGLTINNNLYFANGTGAMFGFFNSLDVANIAAWKTAVGQDAGSFESNPQYIDPTNATPDLHLHPTTATVAEGNGVDVGVTNDYDGQTRASFTPTDIGADAGNFNGLDLSAPNITYTPLVNTSLTTNRTITVTITDVTGVATGGLAPRIYFNKNAGANSSTVLTLSSGTVQNGVWTATIDNSLIGGVVAADVIRYFVVAQDVLGNLTSNPSGGFVGTDVNTVTTPPTTPNQYTIVPSFAGSYNVGTGETYTSLTNTGGIFEAINAGSLTGNVTINITTDLSGELGTVSLNQWSEDGAGGYTMLIRPSGAPRTITGTNTGALIKLNGADRVTIDGSTTGATAAACLVGGDPAIRQLTIQNTNTGTSATVISVQTGTNGAQNNTIKNVNVLGQDPTTTLLGISLGGNTPGTVGTDNDNNRVENCSVKRAIFGIYSAGLSLANQNTGTVIKQNDLSALTTDRIRRVGIIVFNDDGVQITENSVGGVETNESADAIGIGVGTQGIDNTSTTAGGVSNALVSHNKINGVASLSTVGFSAAGIAVAGSNTGANTIQNNMVSGVTAPSTSPDLLAGIYVIGASGSNTRLYHNTISMTGDRGTVASQMPSYGIAITGADPTVDMRNNIIHTSQIASGGGVNAKSYAVGMVTTTFANLTSNYNSYWSTGANDGGFRTGSLSTASGTDYATLALYAAATGKDANSQETDPVFVSATDLHLSTAAGVNWCLNAAGTTIAGVTNDIDCQARGVAPFGPDLGADEITATGLVVNNPTAVCAPTTIDLTAVAVTAGSMGGLTYSYFTDAAATVVLGTPAAVNTSGIYYIKATNGTCSLVLPVVVTVNPQPTAFAVTGGGGYCTGGSGLAVGLSGSETGVNYQLYIGASPAGAAVPGTGAAISFGLQTTAGTYTVVATNGTSSCTNNMTGSATVTINPLPIVYNVTGGGSYCAGGTGVSVGIDGSEAGVNYQLYVGASPVGAAVAGTGSALNFGLQTAAGSYTVVGTNAVTTCTNNMTGSAAVSINPVPVIGSSLIQPTTCVSTDGAIDITMSGAAGPYTYTWSTLDGSGIVPGAEDQTALTVGQYTLVVSAANTCTATATFNLPGPGGCSVCPTIGTLTTNPISPVCFNSTVTLTASGLVSMGVTYGIEFKVSPIPLADPYTGGSTIATVPNAGLTGGGTTATTTTSASGIGSFYLYAILSPAPIDPACRPSALLNVTVNPNPVISIAPAGPVTICAGSNTTLTASGICTDYIFSGVLSGTQEVPPNASTATGFFSGSYNTVSNQLTLNLTFSGMTANVSAGHIHNAGPGVNGPVIIPFTGLPTGVTSGTYSNTFTVPLANVAALLAGNTYINIHTVAFPGGEIRSQLVMNPCSPITSYLWSTTETTPSISVSAANTYSVTATDGNGCSGTASVVVNVNPIPTVNAVASQVLCNGTATTAVAFSGAVPGTVYNWTNDDASIGLAASGSGDIASFNVVNLSTVPVVATITVTPSYTNGGTSCTGTPITFTITVNPTPNAVATPASQTICSGASITTIALTGAVSGTTFNWTRDNTTVTGIAASGSGDISGALTNVSSAPVTVTFTITPTANGCPGTPVTATVVVNPIPNVAATPASQTICSAGSITTIVLAGYGSAIVSGTTFNWTRDNTVSVTGIAASGSGNISGSLTNTTAAPVTVTFTITPIANGCPGTPITATVLVNPTPNAVATPASQTVCTNAAITTIVLSGNVSGTTYSWTRNNTVAVTGLTSGSGNISGTLVNTTTVQQTVTFTITPTANGCPGAPITATVIVNPTPTIVCPANIVVSSTPGVCGAAVTYPPATATGTPAPTITYSIASGSVFPVGLTTVTATATNACGSVSCTFTVRVNDVQPPVITCPANITVNTTAGACTAIVPYTVTATDNCPGVTTALVSGLASGAAFPLGVTTVTHRATDASGNAVTCSFTVTVNDAQVPVISAQPANRTVCTGTNATFTVTATNAVTYQWQSWNGSVWSNITGATGATLTLNNVTSSMSSNSYRVLVNGLCTVVTSNQATLYVNPLPTVSIAPTPLSALLPGQTTSITATTNPSGGSFAWFKNGAAVPGSGAVYGPITIDDIGTYRTVYTDPNGCVSTSANVVITGQVSDNMWVYPNPNIGQFNVRYYNQTGETATLKVYDYLGHEVYSQILPQGITYSNTVVSIPKAAAEVYIVKVVTSTGRELAAKRIVVYH